MAEVTINYKDAAIATMDASGTKTLQTQGKYCEDDIEVVYARPSAPSGTKQINIMQNGTTVEDVAAYANAEITVNVQGGGGHIREAFYLKFRPVETYTISNPLSLQLEASDNCFILVRAVQFPTPDATNSKALIWLLAVTTYDSTHSYSDIAHKILRSNGTIGTDANQCRYDKTTGILLVGGQYGYFTPHDEYEVIQVVFE